MKKTNLIEKTTVIILIMFSIFVMLASFADAIIRPDHVTLAEYGIGIVVMAAGFFILFRLCSWLTERQLKVFVKTVSAVIFLCYVFEIFALQLRPAVDLSHIIEQSLEMLDKGTREFIDENYFSFYTNNIPVAILIYWVFYFGKIIMGEAFNYSIVGGLFNIAIIWIGILCFYRLVDRLTDNYKTASFLKLIMLSNPLFFVYASYYYSDTVAIPISIAAVLFAVMAYQSVEWKRYIYLFLAGILFAVAYRIRVVTLIILIAIVMGLLYRRFWKAVIRLSVVFGISFFIIGSMYSVVYDYHIKFNTIEQAVPVTHFLMMGSHDNGTYDAKDVKYTKSFETHDQRVEKTWEAYCDNLKENGLLGNIKLLLKKEAIWGIGTRGYYQYMSNVHKETLLYQFIAGKYQGMTKGILQAYNLAIMILICLGLFHSRKSLSFMQLILMIYWGGTILFTALWEAHPRHIMTYIPFVMLLVLPFVEHHFGAHSVLQSK